MATDWSDYIPPGKEPEVVELAGKWKHGWIPLDPVATTSKMKGRSGGKKWWSAKKAAPSGGGGKKKVLHRNALRSDQYGNNAFSPGFDEGKARNAGRDNIPSRVQAHPDFDPDTYEAPAPKTDQVLFRKVPGQTSKKSAAAPKGKTYKVGFGRHNPTRAEADKAMGLDKPSDTTKHPRTIHADKVQIKSGHWNETPDTAGFAKAHDWNLPKDYQPAKEQIEAARGALAKKLGVPKSQIKKSVGAMGFFHGEDTYVPNGSGGFTKRGPRSGKA